MLQRGGGHIVGVSSLAGRVWTPYSSSYAAAKSAFCALLEAVRIEVSELHHCVCVCMHACMHPCTHACMCAVVSMCVCAYTHTRIILVCAQTHGRGIEVTTICPSSVKTEMCKKSFIGTTTEKDDRDVTNLVTLSRIGALCPER